jgi:hypothetical protein
MALRLTQSPTYKWPVKVTLPTDDGGATFTFQAVFRRLNQSRITELITASQAKARGEEIDPDLDMSDLDLLSEFMAGWHDVLDDDGEQIPFDRANLSKLAELATAPNQILEQYAASLRGAKSKNSKAPLNT